MIGCRRLGAAGGIALLVQAWTGCTPPESARAFQVTAREQLIGGEGAIGEIGDYMLENGRIRLVVQNTGFSRGNVVFGGGLIDADLVRPQVTGSGAGENGNDQFGEMFTAFFFEALNPREVRVEEDGSGGGPARVVVSGRGGEFLAMTEYLLQAVLDPDTLVFETEYALYPGKNYVEITSRITNDDPRGGVHRFHNIEFEGIRVPVPMGDGLLFGAKAPMFVPGDGGFEQKLTLDERYPVPTGGLPAFPGLVAEYIASRGPGVSYGLLPEPAGDENFIQKNIDKYGAYPGTPSDHSFVMPFTASGLAPIFYAWPPDRLDYQESFSFKRYFIVGAGDVATVADTVHELLGDEVGRFSGRVRETPSLRPIGGAWVVILDRDGEPVNQVETDDEGNFLCTMRPGVYRALIVSSGRETTRPEWFEVESGKSTYLELQTAASGQLLVRVQDERGARIPARATLVGTTDPRSIGVPPHESVYLAAVGEPFRFTDMLEDGEDPETRRYIEAIFIGKDGKIEGNARPGQYDLYVSRGPEYGVSVAKVTLESNETTVVTARLERVVDTSGFISGDFHVHSIGSADSSARLKSRLIDAAAEGLELAVSTDHNYITDYAPTIAALELMPWITSMIGIEMTTLEMGHFNAFPLVYQLGSVTHGSFPWQGLKPDELFAKLRSIGSPDAIVQVNHPRDTLLGYFYQFKLDGETLEHPGRSGLLAPNPENHPEFSGDAFSWDFDAIEILNGKLLDQVHDYRVPTVLPPPPLPEVIPPPGTILREEDGSIAFPGVADDWFTMLEAGMVYTGMANSDSHRTNRADTGYPRTYLAVAEDDPAKVRLADVIGAIRSHAAVMTYCPFVTIGVGDVGVGGTASATDGSVKLDIDIQTSSWCQPERVVIYRGKAVASEIAIPADRARHFQTSVDLMVPGDTFVVVEVIGSRSTFPILPGYELPSIEVSKAITSIAGSLGADFTKWGNLKPLKRKIMYPYALTNPIFIDADGDGAWEPIVTRGQPLEDRRKSLAAGEGHTVTRAHDQIRLLPQDVALTHPIFRVPANASPRDVRRLFWVLASTSE